MVEDQGRLLNFVSVHMYLYDVEGTEMLQVGVNWSWKRNDSDPMGDYIQSKTTNTKE